MFMIACLLVGQRAVLSTVELTGKVGCALSHGCQDAFDSGYSGKQRPSGATSDVESFLIYCSAFNLLQVVKN